MTTKDTIDILAGFASIATAGVAVIAYGGYLFGRWRRRAELLALVKEQAARYPNPQYIGLWQVDMSTAVTKVRAPEDQILEAAFAEREILVDGSAQNRTFRYVPKKSN